MKPVPVSAWCVGLVALAALGPAASGGAVAAPPPGVGTGSVRGVVLGVPDGAPVGRARVTLVPVETGAERTSFTSDGGAFAFSKVPAGVYRLAASKPGWVTTEHGALAPGGRGAPVVVGAGTVDDGVVLRLPRGAVVTGRVFTADGVPAPHQYVSLLKSRHREGGRLLEPIPVAAAAIGFHGSMTDDRGVYRLYEIPAGTYVLAVGAVPQATNYSLRLTTAADVELAERLVREPGRADRSPLPWSRPGAAATAGAAGAVRFAPIYYPGTSVASAALPIAVVAGEERGGLDLRVEAVRAASLEGAVTLAGGGVAPALVQILPHGPDGSWLGRPTAIPVSRDGAFRLVGVTPGDYTIEARTLPADRAGGLPPPDGWTSARVFVDGRDRAGIALRLAPLAGVAGRIVDSTGGAPASGSQAVEVMLVPDGAAPGSWRGPRSVISRDGRFALAGVVPGRYRLTAAVAGGASGPNWIVEAMDVAGHRDPDLAFELSEGQVVTDAVLRLTGRGAAIVGTLHDPFGRPSRGHAVVVFATEPAAWFWRSRWIRVAQPAPDGRYEIRGLPPGAYRVAVVTHLNPGDEFDPALLELLVPASIPVTLAAGQTAVQHLRLGSAPSRER